MINQFAFMARRRKAMLGTTGCMMALTAVLSAVPASAQEAAAEPDQSAATADSGGDIIVTASRREQRVTDLPFNISAYGGEQLERANISSVASLTRQVPNFNIIDAGARTAAAQIPIIRGLNASQTTSNAARYFQSPVGFYLGNAPVTGALPLYDISRVEVLRGPQGTLYGAGSLSGAVRVVPTDPQLGETSGTVAASVGTTSHSSDPSYSFGGIVNLPIGDTLAVRFYARQQREGGFIDAHDVLKRQGDSYINGAPLLADTSDVANSPGVYFNEKDYNYADTTSARAALRWEPTEDFSLSLAYNFAKSKGVGGNIDNNSFEGGASPLDPRIQLEATGDYERSIPMLEPWKRRTELASLDASYDLGFATVAATVAYGETKGESSNDSTISLLGSPYGFFYTGAPANPRAVIPVANNDRDRSWTQELRIVSKEGGFIDYTAGVFLQQQRRKIDLFVYAPGAAEQSFAAGGSRTPIYHGFFGEPDATYIPTLSDSLTYSQVTSQRFREVSFFGDVTFHLTDAWSVTGGARVFKQKFSSDQDLLSTLFAPPGSPEVDGVGVSLTNSASSTKGTDQIFKVNTSYKLEGGGQIYATFSQGFRRGGTNTFSTPEINPIIFEPEALVVYKPDRTNNFEVGIKGSMSRIYYSLSAFYIDWKDPQIDLQTPYNLFPAVVNGSAAESKGFEVELSGPIAIDGLSFNLGLAYARARLSEDFGLPAGDGAGSEVPNAIRGVKGDQLPGAPDWSGAGSLIYTHAAGKGEMTWNLGFDFRSGTWNQLRSQSTNTPASKQSGYVMLNGSIGYAIDDWNIELYGTNLLDKRAVYAANLRTLNSIATLGNWGNSYSVSRPREVGIRLSKSW
ncbi:TonB-dependent receptor [Sphingopyxis indica]|uniref:TonB-dependent receptor n=1 Tax=Sphingopyxis indica TaxID=436663 RepID=UPI002938DC6B|nr:TonB-dependent receptor [Sphingopyxis indica]WOF42527.1 TonB-dependent receptor [Sphingopyxis indica]